MIMARILVIDDEETIRFAFESFLSDAGHAVVVAESCDQAFGVFEEACFDLVLTDIILGDGTGIEILRSVRERQPNCPVVMITGQPSLETAAQAVRLGAFDYIEKPVRQQALLDVVERALRHKELVEQKERDHSRLEAIFRSVEDAIITVDTNKIVTEVNGAAGKICGFAGDTVGKPFVLLRRCVGTNCLELIDQAIAEGKTCAAAHVECLQQDNSCRVVTIIVSPLVGEGGETSGAILTVKDETPSERTWKQCRKFHDLVGNSERMQRVYALIEDLASVPTTVLITGETGTGKELVASALHCGGDRKEKPFVKVNCSALSENLLESELFGHVKGAFTGAINNKVGRFEKADNGTIFLDEIGDISPRIQSRLLRVLQEKEFERVGDSTTIKTEARVVAATNKDLRAKLELGEFREDLYYRLKVVEIHLPPLRERQEDIPLLTEHFLERFNAAFGKKIISVSSEVRKIFLDYPWPGNVRELEHALEHAFIVCNQDVILVSHLPQEFGKFRKIEDSSAMNRRVADRRTPMERIVADRETIVKALEKTAGNKARASRILGVSRQTMYRKIEEYGIE
jgi:PAS domain S-box-containing protein